MGVPTINPLVVAVVSALLLVFDLVTIPIPPNTNFSPLRSTSGSDQTAPRPFCIFANISPVSSVNSVVGPTLPDISYTVETVIALVAELIVLTK